MLPLSFFLAPAEEICYYTYKAVPLQGPGMPGPHV